MPPLSFDERHTATVLAVAAATVSSYAAFSLAGRGIRANRHVARVSWLAAASVVLGFGLWSMHYVNDLAEGAAVNSGQDVTRVLICLAAAVLSSGLAFWTLVLAPATWRRQILSGGLLGIGMILLAVLGVASRYVGGMDTERTLRLLGCAALGIGSAQLAIGLSFGRTRSYKYEEWLRAGGALMLGLGLAAAQLIAVRGAPAGPASATPASAWVISSGALSETALTATIVLVMAVTLTTAALDQRRYRELVELNARLAESQKALLESQSKLREANAMLGELSIRDGLTGLYNRRHFDEALDTEWRRSVRSLRPLALLMLDVDCFKALNDTYGHARGDECLREMARVLEDMPRRGHDVVARYGGEEFAVLLPGADSAGAMRIAEYIRSSVEALQMEHRRSSVAHVVTVSIGVSCRVPQMQEGPGAMMHEADMALYLAKQMGRNRVELRENLHTAA
jgi:diguanylate cyclase